MDNDQLRLECLKVASQQLGKDSKPEDVIAYARNLMRYVERGESAV